MKLKDVFVGEILPPGRFIESIPISMFEGYLSI